MAPHGSNESIFASAGTGLTCCSATPCPQRDVCGGRSQPDLFKTAGVRRPLASPVPRGHCTAPAWQETGELLFFFSLFSPHTVLWYSIRSFSSDCSSFGTLSSCLQTNTFLGSKLWRRLEEAPPRREHVGKFSWKLLLPVLGCSFQ